MERAISTGGAPLTRLTQLAAAERRSRSSPLISMKLGCHTVASSRLDSSLLLPNPLHHTKKTSPSSVLSMSAGLSPTPSSRHIRSTVLTSIFPHGRLTTATSESCTISSRRCVHTEEHKRLLGFASDPRKGTERRRGGGQSSERNTAVSCRVTERSRQRIWRLAGTMVMTAVVDGNWQRRPTMPDGEQWHGRTSGMPGFVVTMAILRLSCCSYERPPARCASGHLLPEAWLRWHLTLDDVDGQA